MRRLVPIIALCAIAFTSSGCRKKNNKPRTDLVVSEEPAGLVTMLHMADPRGAVQLLRGFHEVEESQWRWTAGEFAVTLKVPNGAAQRGANLILKFAVAEPSINKFGSVTITGRLDTTDLAPETYTAAGLSTYTREIPATALTGESVNVTFKVGNFIPASESDQRDLGVIASLIGLEVK